MIFIMLTRTAIAQEKSLYDFPAPKGWQTEKIKFPINFAPAIPFAGTEDLHFTPGWSKPESDQYWSYVFVWFLDGKVKPTTDDLAKYLEQYYTGLYMTNLGKKSKPETTFTSVSIKDNSKKGKDQYYNAEINTLDFLSGKPLKLLVRLDVRSLGHKHTAVLFQASPKAYGHGVWNTLSAVIDGFKVNR